MSPIAFSSCPTMFCKRFNSCPTPLVVMSFAGLLSFCAAPHSALRRLDISFRQANRCTSSGRLFRHGKNGDKNWHSRFVFRVYEPLD